MLVPSFHYMYQCPHVLRLRTNDDLLSMPTMHIRYIPMMLGPWSIIYHAEGGAPHAIHHNLANFPLVCAPSLVITGTCSKIAQGGGQCGASASGACCPTGQCCSQYGYCGVDTAHCGVGCQQQFSVQNSCGNTASVFPPPKPSPQVQSSPPGNKVASPANTTQPARVNPPISNTGEQWFAKEGWELGSSYIRYYTRAILLAFPIFGFHQCSFDV